MDVLLPARAWPGAALRKPQKDFCRLPKLGEPPKLGDVSKGAACSKMATAKLGRMGRSYLGDVA